MTKTHNSDESHRLLIIDDTLENLHLLSERLGAEGFDIRCARDGHTGIRGALSAPPDLILLDVLMPGLDGFAVCQRLKQHRHLQEVPVIFLTAVDRPEDKVMAFQVGGSDYITKPFQFQEVLARVRHHLDLVSARRQLQRYAEKLEQQIADRTAHLEAANLNFYRELVEHRQALERLRLRDMAIHETSDGVAVADARLPDLPLVDVNPAFERITGYRREEIIGRNCRYLQGQDRQQPALEALRETLQQGRSGQFVLRNYRKDGSAFWNQLTLSPVYDADGVLTHYVGIQHDITEAYNLQQQLRHQAHHDALTGLANRWAFESRLETLLASAQQGGNHVLCYLDLDQFKVVNDLCGHLAGDELLRRLGQHLGTVISGQSLLARLGGDEFGVLLEDCELSQGHELARQLRQSIQAFRFVWEERQFRLGVSIGVVPINNAYESATEVMSLADSACYTAKDQGRNRIYVVVPDDQELRRRHREMLWVSRIERALDENRCYLVLQPIVSLDEAEAGEHCEVLLRIRETDGRSASPGEFLPAAERYGLMGRLDHWVVQEVLQWLSSHPERLAQLRLCSINLSGHSLGDAELLAAIEEMLRRYTIPPQKLCFEVTETAAISHLQSAMAFINRLRALGCRFALDDFGSGLSSFAYLRDLPVDFLKIDGMFVRQIESNPADLALVTAMNDLAHVLGKHTVAEYVDSPGVLARLREIGVDYAQGHLFGEPVALQKGGSHP